MTFRRGFWLLGAMCIGAPELVAQQVRGEVRDSSNRQVVAGAIVMLLDSSGRSLVRNLTDESGRYTLPLLSSSQRLRVMRIGFKPRELVLAGLVSTTAVDVALVPVPTFLQAISVTAASGCPARSDRAQALSLYEQARTGLLATVVAREANPARMVLYTFNRAMDGTSDRVISQTVGVDSAARAKVSFGAGQSARDFVKNGFVSEVGTEKVFFGPDADVLLSEEFAGGYCLAIARPSRDRPNQIGLAFEAAQRRRERVDIEGALWIDTVARALKDIEFRFVGLGRRYEMHDPGGRIEFREMPNGAVLVDRWKLRLIGTYADTVPGGKDSTVLVRLYAAESGGELASARWRDGKTWHASLGRLRVRATNARGAPVVGADLQLDDTPYRSRTDTAGVADFPDVIPGPYTLVIRDSLLESVSVRIPTLVSFSAVRDSVHAVTLRVPTASEFIYARCVRDKRNSPLDSTRLLVRVMTYTDDPVEDVSWKVSRRRGPFFDGGKTGADGMFQICNAHLGHGTTLALVASRAGWEDAVDEVTVTGTVTVVKLVMTPKP